MGNVHFQNIDATHRSGRNSLPLLRSMCPGVLEFYEKQTDPAMSPLKITSCKDRHSMEKLRFQGQWVYGRCDDSFSFCYIPITAPRDMVVHVRIGFEQRLSDKSRLKEFRYSNNGGHPRARVEENSQHASRSCGYEVAMLFMPSEIYDSDMSHTGLAGFHNPWYRKSWRLDGVESSQHVSRSCEVQNFRQAIPKRGHYLYISTTNRLYLSYENRPPLLITFEVVKPMLNVRYTSDYSGFVNTSYREGFGTVCDQLSAPNGHAIMIIFEWIHCGVSLHESGNTLKRKPSNINDPFVIRFYKSKHVDVCLHLNASNVYERSCFKLLFSFHPEHSLPKTSSSGLYNCSVDDYRNF